MNGMLCKHPHTQSFESWSENLSQVLVGCLSLIESTILLPRVQDCYGKFPEFFVGNYLSRHSKASFAKTTGRISFPKVSIAKSFRVENSSSIYFLRSSWYRNIELSQKPKFLISSLDIRTLTSKLPEWLHSLRGHLASSYLFYLFWWDLPALILQSGNWAAICALCNVFDLYWNSYSRKVQRGFLISHSFDNFQLEKNNLAVIWCLLLPGIYILQAKWQKSVTK